MPITRVKICGITSVADAHMAIDAGADAIGLVFYAQSPRYVGLDAARAIALAAGPLVTVVGLFVNATAAEVNAVLARVPLHVLQFHGDEEAAFCEQFERPYMKALRMRPDFDPVAAMAAYSSASGILLDAYRAGVPGGTGETFDWQRFPAQSKTPLVLAGGLTPANVASAIAATHPYAVDVSGGVEAAPGQKSSDKIIAFMAAVKRSERQSGESM